MNPALSAFDQVIAAADRALRTLAAEPHSTRSTPAAAEDVSSQSPTLSETERREAIALMRVNHVGEICAQALYDAQALGARSQQLREKFQNAAAEESDHLAWTRQRIEQLGGRTSLLNPLWYAGAFALAFAAARVSDRASLSFMAETERQVERHLQSHLERLPENDLASRAIVEQMKNDEAQHAQAATAEGAVDLPLPLRWGMRLAARVMTKTAHYV